MQEKLHLLAQSLFCRCSRRLKTLSSNCVVTSAQTALTGVCQGGTGSFPENMLFILLYFILLWYLPIFYSVCL